MAALTRRRLLRASAGAVLAGLAGCTSDGENPDSTTGESSVTTGTERITTGSASATTGETDTPEATETSTTTDETAETSESSTTDSGDHHIHGKLMLEIDGERVDLSQSKYHEANTGNSTFHFHDDGHPYKWHNHAESVTVEYALEALPDIEYEEDDGSAVLTVDGTTYRASDPDTTLVFRQRTTDVDPRTYELADGDIIWVKAYTEGRTETPHA